MPITSRAKIKVQAGFGENSSLSESQYRDGPFVLDKRSRGDIAGVTLILTVLDRTLPHGYAYSIYTYA